jgi:hypothetical protein
VIRTASSERLRLTLRRGATSLGAEAAGAVRDFVFGQFNEDGGFRGRSRESDVYYTVFGLECARALGLELPVATVGAFLRRRAAAAVLDFVHLTCLARCLEILGQGTLPDLAGWIAQGKQQLAAHGCAGGGYHRLPGKRRGSIYDSFLGMLACEAFGEPFPAPHEMVQCLVRLQKASGGFVNDEGFGAPTTPVTAAALGLYWELQHPAPPISREWLLARLSPKGGFCAATLVPVPDLLSTATALHAVRTHGWIGQVPIEPCVEFVTSVWDESGGFGGHVFDRRADCEYTFYALLALGNLVSDSTP